MDRHATSTLERTLGRTRGVYSLVSDKVVAGRVFGPLVHKAVRGDVTAVTSARREGPRRAPSSRHCRDRPFRHASIEPASSRHHRTRAAAVRRRLLRRGRLRIHVHQRGGDEPVGEGELDEGRRPARRRQRQRGLDAVARQGQRRFAITDAAGIVEIAAVRIVGDPQPGADRPLRGARTESQSAAALGQARALGRASWRPQRCRARIRVRACAGAPRRDRNSAPRAGWRRRADRRGRGAAHRAERNRRRWR
jgi:hypothetical protein